MEPKRFRWDGVAFNGRSFMSRFSWNRHWTLIFALGVCLSFLALTPRHAVSDPSMGPTGDETVGSGSGTTGIGDPDVPDGTGKSKTGRSGALSRNGNPYLRLRVAGDDRTQSVLMWRLYVAWLASRSYWFRF